jgi:pimeloyl-ACP methyl ester carboxylesterase
MNASERSLDNALPLPEALEARPQGRLVAINDMEMYYETYGEGEPLVLLHGFFGHGEAWQSYIDRLSKRYHLIIPDLRGHGRSNNPSGGFTHGQAAVDVFALLDSLGIDRFRAMGISTGGMTLLHMATQQPSRVEAMVLLAATIYFPESARAIMRQHTVDSLTPEQMAHHREHHRYGDDQIRELYSIFYGFKDSYDDMNFTAPYLSTISANTLIVHGDRDVFFPVSIPVEMYRSIPNSYLWIIPNGGHGLPPGYVELVIDHALAFFRGEWESQ